MDGWLYAQSYAHHVMAALEMMSRTTVIMKVSIFWSISSDHCPRLSMQYRTLETSMGPDEDRISRRSFEATVCTFFCMHWANDWLTSPTPGWSMTIRCALSRISACRVLISPCPPGMKRFVAKMTCACREVKFDQTKLMTKLQKPIVQV